MSKSPNDMSDDSADLLTEISVAYYQDGATQEEISKKFAVSRAKVGRMLKQARDEGIVEITVKYHPVFSSKIEQVGLPGHAGYSCTSATPERSDLPVFQSTVIAFVTLLGNCGIE